MDSTTSILVTLKHPHHQYDSEFLILQDFLSISTHSIIYFSPSLSFVFRLSPVMNTFVSHIWRCWIYDCVCRVNASKWQSGINVSSLRIVDVWIMNKYDWTSFKFTLSLKGIEPHCTIKFVIMKELFLLKKSIAFYKNKISKQMHSFSFKYINFPWLSNNNHSLNHLWNF